MKVVELLKIGGELLKLMSANDVLRDDWRYVSLYEEYQMMRENGLKHIAAVKMLSEEQVNQQGAVYEHLVARDRTLEIRHLRVL